MSNLFDLTGKTAVVVGGTSTLGSEMALGLAEHGAKVAIVGRDMDKAETIVNKIETDSKAFQADVLSKDSLEKLVNKIADWSNTLDIVVNAPGKNSATPFFELAMEEWDSIMDVNLKGVVLTCQIFSKRMAESGGGGSIINISSASSETPLSKVFTYSASKAGINSITQSLAYELAPHKIRVNAIIPGFFPAEQNRKILSEDRIQSIMNHTPMKRFGEPEELKGAAVWLASDKASSFVTGSLIQVDGGFTSMTI